MNVGREGRDGDETRVAGYGGKRRGRRKRGKKTGTCRRRNIQAAEKRGSQPERGPGRKRENERYGRRRRRKRRRRSSNQYRATRAKPSLDFSLTLSLSLLLPLLSLFLRLSPSPDVAFYRCLSIFLSLPPPPSLCAPNSHEYDGYMDAIGHRASLTGSFVRFHYGLPTVVAIPVVVVPRRVCTSTPARSGSRRSSPSPPLSRVTCDYERSCVHSCTRDTRARVYAGACRCATNSTRRDHLFSTQRGGGSNSERASGFRRSSRGGWQPFRFKDSTLCGLSSAEF